MSLPKRFVQDQRRLHGRALVAGILNADPTRRVDRAVVVDERDPGVIGLQVLPDAAVRHNDDAARRVVRAALGRVDRAVDLHVLRHRVELAVGCRVDRQTQAVLPTEDGCGPVGAAGCCADAPATIPITRAIAAVVHVANCLIEVSIRSRSARRSSRSAASAPTSAPASAALAVAAGLKFWL